MQYALLIIRRHGGLSTGLLRNSPVFCFECAALHKLDRQRDKDLRHIVQHVQNRVAVGAVVFAEGEHDQHIIARREADAADKEQEQRPVGLDKRACRRACRHEQNTADIKHAERRNFARAYLLGICVEAGRAQRHHRDGDRVQPRRRAERQDRENIHDMAQKKRHGASSEEQPVQLFRQKPQRQKQIAQHPERQSRHDIPSVQTRPHPPQQHEHHRRHGLEYDRRRIAPLIRAHDEQRLQYRARTDQQNLQHPPPPFPRVPSSRLFYHVRRAAVNVTCLIVFVQQLRHGLARDRLPKLPALSPVKMPFSLAHCAACSAQSDGWSPVPFRESSSSFVISITSMTCRLNANHAFSSSTHIAGHRLLTTS